MDLTLDEVEKKIKSAEFIYQRAVDNHAGLNLLKYLKKDIEELKTLRNKLLSETVPAYSSNGEQSE